MIEQAIADKLVEAGLGEKGKNIFINTFPDSPDELIAVMNTGSLAPLRDLSGKVVLERVLVQILVRAPTIVRANALAYMVLETLQNEWLEIRTSPTFLERDQRNRAVYFMNLAVPKGGD